MLDMQYLFRFGKRQRVEVYANIGCAFAQRRRRQRTKIDYWIDDSVLIHFVPLIQYEFSRIFFVLAPYRFKIAPHSITNSVFAYRFAFFAIFALTKCATRERERERDWQIHQTFRRCKIDRMAKYFRIRDLIPKSVWIKMHFHFGFMRTCDDIFYSMAISCLLSALFLSSHFAQLAIYRLREILCVCLCVSKCSKCYNLVDKRRRNQKHLQCCNSLLNWKWFRNAFEMHHRRMW